MPKQIHGIAHNILCKNTLSAFLCLITYIVNNNKVDTYNDNDSDDASDSDNETSCDDSP